MATVQSISMSAQPAQTPHHPEPSGQKRKLRDSGGHEADSPGIMEPKEEIDPDSYGADGPNVDDLPMSESKRRAQNRAAQRAFRERKERRLKELETRLAELESESRSWKSTNLVLRSQLSLLEEQLNHYRNPATQAPQQHQGQQSAPHQHNNPINSSQSQYSGHSSLYDHSNTSPPLSHQSSNNYKSGGNNNQHLNPSNVQIPSPNNSSTLIDLTLPDSNQIPTASEFSGLNDPNFGRNVPGLLGQNSQLNEVEQPSRAEVFCEKLSMACGTRDRPVSANAPRISADVPGWQTDGFANNNTTADWVMQNGGWMDESVNTMNRGGKNSYTSQQPSPYEPGDLKGPFSSSRRRISQQMNQQQISSQNMHQRDQQQIPSPNNTTSSGQSNQMAPDPLNLDFGNLANGFGEFSLGGMLERPDNLDFGGEDMNQLLDNDFGVFDPLDNLLGWEPGMTPSGTMNQNTSLSNQINPDMGQTGQMSASANQGLGGSSDIMSGKQLHGPASTIPPHQMSASMLSTELPAPPSHQPGLARQLPPAFMGSLSTLEAQQKYREDRKVEEEVPATSQKFIPCADVWDRICSHPRFGEIDINSMCQELRNKARCSKTGVVLDEQDVDSVLKALR